MFLLFGLALAAGVLAPSHAARAAIGFVQENQSVPSGCGSCSATTISFTANNTAGNLIVVAFDYDAAVGLTSVTDTQGNVYVRAGTEVHQGAGNWFADIYYAKNIASGANSVTVKLNGAASYMEVYIHEYSGLDTAFPLDATAGSIGNSGSDDSGPATTNFANELVFGFGTSSFTAGPGFTARSITPFGESITEDRIVSAIGTYDATASFNGSNWSMQMATFRAASRIQVSSRSDTLSNSQPSVTSNHTVVFTTNTAVYGSSISGSSTVTIGFPSAFSIPVGMDCGDVDVSTSSQFNFNYPGCNATATAWGFSATGYVVTLIAPTDSNVHVATSTPITIKIGSNATVGQQGAHWITNPSAAGIYTVSVGGTFNGSGNMLVSINAGVRVSATVAESLAFTVNPVPSVKLAQVKVGTSNFAGNPNTLAFDSNTATGNLIVAAINWQFNAGTATVSSVNDTQNNTYTVLTTVATSTNSYTQIASVIAYAYNTKGGADTVSVTLSSAPARSQMTLYEFSGIATSTDPLDQQSTAMATSTTPNAGTVLTSVNGEAAVSASMADNGSGSDVYGAGTGWTLEGHTAGGGEDTGDEYQIQGLAGSLAGNFTNTNGKWTAAMATFKGAPSCIADDGATITQIGTTAVSVPFGFISPNTFYQGCQDLVVSTNAGNGYSVTVQESSAMKTANGQFTIPDTTCDAGDCTVATATTWVTPTNNGFGHTCFNQSGSDCAGVYANGTKFRPLSNTAAGNVQSGWYDSNWGYRKRIRIASSQVVGSATSFPVLINSTDTAWRHTSFGGHVGSATGWDFVITGANGVTKLNHEIETYASSTGALVAWVLVPLLSTTTVNELFVYYGNAAASNQQNPTGVWNANYQGVWHLPNGSTLTANDSTGNANNSDSITANATVGQIDGGATWTNNSYVRIPDNASLRPTIVTMSAWVKPATGFSGLLFIKDKGTGTSYDLEDNENSPGNLAFCSYVSGAYTCAAVSDSSYLNQWTYVVGVYDGTNRYIYVNGILKNTQPGGAIDYTSPAQLFFGYSAGVAGTASADEGRVSNIVRSASWISTEYNNQSSPSTFYSMFSEEMQASSGQVLMANSGSVTNSTGRVKYRLSAGAAQPAGTYTTIITYTIYAAY